MIGLTTLPYEILYLATLGRQEIRNPVKAVHTLSTMSTVCKQLRNAVNQCWGLVIQNSDLIAYLDPSAREHVNPLQCLKEKYLVLKKWGQVDPHKWKHNTPDIQQSTYAFTEEHRVVQNSTGQLELWNHIPSSQLTCTDLTTSIATTVVTKQNFFCKALQPGLLNHYLGFANAPSPHLASADDWFAIYSSILDQVLVFEKNGSEIIRHRLTDIGKALEIQVDGKYLFVLSSYKKTLLRYDSTDWAEQPKEFSLPSLLHFCVGPNEILFSTNKTNHGQYDDIFLINKEEAFSEISRTRAFIRFAHTGDWMFKSGKECIFAIKWMSQDQFSLEKIICLKESEPVIEPIQTFSVEFVHHMVDFYVLHMVDFYVLHDRLFIAIFIDTKIKIFCYGLANGELLKVFPIENEGIHVFRNLYHLFASTPERIHQIYHARDMSDALGSKKVLAVTTLDYKA